MIRTIFILVLVLTFSQGIIFLNDDPAATLICNGCQFVVNIVETRLKAIELVTRNDLTTFADKACARIPDLEVFKTLCTQVKDDLIDIAVQLIEAFERQINGNVTCKNLRLCA
ncbi:hypothetical protein GCK72_017950 [Caenorhabditis remanei]|uniref:Uncharacterized protein n=1 Tax=Caenorhabditis remanei TaxID=31234 RepID=A0A2P4UT02_CAERE|nr:hypothetical protein GCK72_017950 [Caenorhabditis remanei]KAF1751396.1 hypothetical protein GCK72_017950 [Caenorhabditis remanei]